MSGGGLEELAEGSTHLIRWVQDYVGLHATTHLLARVGCLAVAAAERFDGRRRALTDHAARARATQLLELLTKLICTI